MASITNDPWQTAFESNVGSPTMNIDEVDSPLKQLWNKVQIEKNDQCGNMGGKGLHHMFSEFEEKSCPKELCINGYAKCNCELFYHIPLVY